MQTTKLGRCSQSSCGLKNFCKGICIICWKTFGSRLTVVKSWKNRMLAWSNTQLCSDGSHVTWCSTFCWKHEHALPTDTLTAQIGVFVVRQFDLRTTNKFSLFVFSEKAYQFQDFSTSLTAETANLNTIWIACSRQEAMLSFKNTTATSCHYTWTKVNWSSPVWIVGQIHDVLCYSL